MSKILILVEGHTEELFVRDVLNPGVNGRGLYLVPKIITTKVVKGGPNCKGGINSYIPVKRDIQRLLQDSSAVAVSTMIDFYALPDNFPSSEGSGSCYDQVRAKEQAFADDINNEKFIPHVQLHEFEGLLFSSPDMICNALDPLDSTKNLKVHAIRNAVNNPEEINQGEDTHPSRRLLDIFPGYNKSVYGTLIAQRTGLEKICEECPHFKDWFSKLSLLA